MSNRGFPTASAFLEMQERRRQYRKHIDALRSCKHLVDDSQPIPPSYLVNRRTRQIELQRYIIQTGEENIRLISRYNQSRNKSKKGVSQSKTQNSRPNWVSEMYNSMAISRKAYTSFDQKEDAKSKKLPPLNPSLENENIPEEKQEGISNNISTDENNAKDINNENDNITNKQNSNENENQDADEIQDQNADESQDQNRNENQDQNENENQEPNENQEQTENENQEQNEAENQDQAEEEIQDQNENENQVQNENDTQDQDQNENQEQNENQDQNENQEQNENEDQDRNENENQDQNENKNENQDQNENLNDIAQKEDEDTTLGGEGEKGRLTEMLDVLNGITE